jgi:hypothetical protein
MRLYLSGLVSMGFLVAGFCFMRFWKRTGDRLFIVFMTAFWMMALEKAVLAFVPLEYEHRPYVFCIRLVAFGLIVLAIIDKNRASTTTD